MECKFESRIGGVFLVFRSNDEAEEAAAALEAFRVYVPVVSFGGYMNALDLSCFQDMNIGMCTKEEI